jgi:hypothetical protein
MFDKEGACLDGGAALPVIVQGNTGVVGEQSHGHTTV